MTNLFSCIQLRGAFIRVNRCSIFAFSYFFSGLHKVPFFLPSEGLERSECWVTGEWCEANPCSVVKGCAEYLGQFNKTNYKCILQIQSVFRHVQTGFNANPWPHNVANMHFRHPHIVVWETFVNLASDKWCLSYGTTVKYTCKRLFDSHLVWLLN